MEQHQINWKKYVYAFVITAIIFATAIFLSNYFEQKKIDDIKAIQDKISIEIMSSETQFSLLEESSCQDLGGQSALSDELGSLEQELSYAQSDRGANDPEVQTLKQYYSILEIKDYILMQKISEKCGKAPSTIIYFYSNNNCADCEREGYVLTDLRQQFPDLRVYSFDYNLDISALQTLIAISKVKDDLPAIFIKDKMYYGFQSESDIEKIMPELLATSTATSTKAKK